MRRREDWPSRLSEYITASLARPFIWGEHDCCLFAAGAVAAMTGVDPAASFRGKYKTSTGAMRFLAAVGGLVPMIERIADQYHMTEIETRFAQRGDVVLVHEVFTNWEGPAVGILSPSGSILLLSENGLIDAPVLLAERAWSV